MLAFEWSMDDSHQASAEKVRSLIERGSHDRGMFRAALLSVPPAIRDGWLDVVFGLGDLPNDGPELPRGCVQYVPSSVDALLRVVEQAPVRGSDVFVDVGSGLGRAAALVHLLTGAAVIGLEIQPHLIVGARDLTARLLLSRISSVEGDAARLAGYIPIGSYSSSTAPSAANVWRECWETWSTSRGPGSFASAASICLCPHAPG
jgi:SAM-dependent methyltransferase